MPKIKEEKPAKDSMQALVDEMGSSLVPIKEGEVIEVTILAKSKNRILVDVAGFTHGIILDKEFSVDVNELEAGDTVLAYVLTPENKDGYSVLSLRKADKERFNQRINKKFEDQENIKVRISQANKGGLIAEYGGLEGFLPVSQLSSDHYPKVGDDKGKILEKLQQFIGQDLSVKIINYDKEQNKLIFSEKAAMSGEIKEIVKSFQVGQELEGTVSGVVDFGLFVELGKIEGLVHISEVSWDRIDDLKSMFKIGDKVKVQVISVEDNKISLSIKRLLPDPWLKKVKEYKVDSIVEGEIERITPFGAFVRLKNNVSGLVHISELTEETKDKAVEDVLNIGKTYKFKILSIEAPTHKINLSLQKDDKAEKSSVTKEKAKKKTATK